MNSEDVIEIREEFGFTQQKFAELVGVTRRTVVNWEQGSKIPDHQINLLKFLLDQKRNSDAQNTVVEKAESITAIQTIENLNREIFELKDHIKTLRDLVDEKTIVVELYKNENARMKERLNKLEEYSGG